MILRITRPNGCLQVPHQSVTIDLRRRLSQLFRQQIHQVLHEVSLSHEEVLSDREAMSFKFEFVKKDLNQRFVGYLVGVVYPFV